jgi:hypothetical protein
VVERRSERDKIFKRKIQQELAKVQWSCRMGEKCNKKRTWKS